MKKLLTNHILFERQSELHINLTIFFCFVKPLGLGLGLDQILDSHIFKHVEFNVSFLLFLATQVF